MICCCAVLCLVAKAQISKHGFGVLCFRVRSNYADLRNRTIYVHILSSRRLVSAGEIEFGWGR
jgi:hypothetical protein